MRDRQKSVHSWLFGAVSVSLLAAAIAISHSDFRSVLGEIRQLSAAALLGAATLLVVGALLATVRLWFISSDIGLLSVLRRPSSR